MTVLQRFDALLALGGPPTRRVFASDAHPSFSIEKHPVLSPTLYTCHSTYLDRSRFAAFQCPLHCHCRNSTLLMPKFLLPYPMPSPAAPTGQASHVAPMARRHPSDSQSVKRKDARLQDTRVYHRYWRSPTSWLWEACHEAVRVFCSVLTFHPKSLSCPRHQPQPQLPPSLTSKLSSKRR